MLRRSKSNLLIALLSIVISFPSVALQQVLQSGDFINNQPDTTGVWYHISQQQRELANAEMERLVQRYPQWQVPLDLQQAIQKLNQPEPVKKQVSKAPRKPSHNDKVKQQEAVAWALFNDGRFEEALAQFNALEALETNVRRQEEKAVVVNRWLAHLLEKRDWQALETLLVEQPLETSVGVVTAAAWSYFEQREYATALRLFTLSRNDYGRGLAYFQLGNLEQAIAVSCADIGHLPSQDNCVQWLFERQRQLFESSRFEESIAISRLIAEKRDLGVSERELLAWSYIQLQQDEVALEQFIALAKQDEGNDKWREAIKLIVERNENAPWITLSGDNIVRGTLLQKKARQAWQRKQFDLAYRQGFDVSRAIYEKDRLVIYSGLSGSTRTGDVGLDNFDVAGAGVGLTGLSHGWRWWAELHYQQLYSGAAQENAWFGAGQTSQSFTGITGFEDKGVTLRALRQVDDANYFAYLGLQQFSQPVSASVAGMLSTVQYRPDNVFGVSLYHLPKTDSLLSYAGTFTEQLDMTWGRAMSLGGRGIFISLLSPEWTVSVNAQVEQIQGKGIKDNDFQALRTDVMRQFNNSDFQNLDYFRVGPYLAWSSYRNNQSGFTLGNGGYFSPQNWVNVGASAELLTEEGKAWQMRVAVSLGYNWIHLDAYDRFPFFERDEQAAASDIRGFGGEIRAEGHYLVTSQLGVKGYVRRLDAKQFSQTDVGIQFQWHFSPRSGMTSDELLLSTPLFTGFAF